MRRKTPFVIGAIVALVLGLGAGAAFAFFTTHGSGAGSGQTGTLQPVTVAASAGTASTPLLPGDSGDVVLQVTNPNSLAVTLVTVSGNGTITADGSHGSCTTTGVAFTNQTGLNINIPANTTTPVDLAGAASMDTTSSNGCQGATFSIPVSITVHEG